MLVRGICDRTKHNALVEPEQVRGSQNDPDRRPRRVLDAHFVRAAQDGELSYKSVQQRETQRAE